MVFFLQVLLLEVTLTSNVSVNGRKGIRVSTHMDGTPNFDAHLAETHRTESRPKLLGAKVQICSSSPVRALQYMPEFEGIGV